MLLSLYRKLLVAIVFVTISTSMQAQSDSLNIVSTAVPFLRISPDARSGGMGDVAIATLPDANSGFWNLAKIPFTKKQASVALNYTPWLKDLGLTDVYLASMAMYYKLDEESAISSSMRFFSLGNIQLTDNSGNLLNSVKPSEFCIDFGYTRKLYSSSPGECRGEFYKVCSAKLPNNVSAGDSFGFKNELGWNVMRVTAFECPHIKEYEIQKEKAKVASESI